jgi:hypothetical protein
LPSFYWLVEVNKGWQKFGLSKPTRPNKLKVGQMPLLPVAIHEALSEQSPGHSDKVIGMFAPSVSAYGKARVALSRVGSFELLRTFQLLFKG